jgi:hypothetical protein
VCALSLYIEDEGVPTVCISLVREHAEAIRPPRSLWVPFILGRPLGVPDDPAFQRRVLRAALSLFERPLGPVLEDFPEDAPGALDESASEGTACPVDFSRPQDELSLERQVLEEVAQLRTWHDIALRRRGRTALGVAGATIEDLVRFLYSWVSGGDAPSYRADVPVANALRLACEEIKAFYFEANAGQPGTRQPDAVALWFWHQTAAGRLLFALAPRTEEHVDPAVRHFATQNLLPRLALDHNTGAAASAKSRPGGT